MDRFTIPRDLYYGRGALSRLKQLNGSRAMLVCGAAARQSGFLRRQRAFCRKRACWSAPLYARRGDQPLPWPSQAPRRCRNSNLVGSWPWAGRRAYPQQKRCGLFMKTPASRLALFWKRAGCRCCAGRREWRLCRLAGAGKPPWAARRFCWTPPRAAGICCGIRSWRPDMAIIDPDLAAPCSGTILARGGMAALSQALEAMYHGQAGLAYPLALHAACVIFDKLQPAAGGDVTARAMLHEGQCMAGLAFSNAPAGLCTAMAAELCVAFYKPLPTGIGEAVCLPLTLSRDPGAKNAAARICASLGYPGECLEALRSRIILLRGGLDMPESLQAFGIEEAEFLSKLPDLCKRLSHTSILPKNRCPTPKDAEELFRQAYYGS